MHFGDSSRICNICSANLHPIIIHRLARATDCGRCRDFLAAAQDGLGRP
jgi:hypothetical protein